MLVLRIRQLKMTKKAPLLQGVPNHLKMIYLSGYLGFLSYHHHFPCLIVANLNHIGAAGRSVEAQRRTVVLLGGQDAAGDIIQRHHVAVGTLHHNLSAVGVDLGVDAVHATYTLLGDVDGVVVMSGDIDGVIVVVVENESIKAVIVVDGGVEVVCIVDGGVEMIDIHYRGVNQLCGHPDGVVDVVIDDGCVVDVMVHVLNHRVVHIVVDESGVVDIVVDGVAEDKGVRQSEESLQCGVGRDGEGVGIVGHTVAPGKEYSVAQRDSGQCRRAVEGYHAAAHYRTLEGIGGGGSDQHAIDGEDCGECRIAV